MKSHLRTILLPILLIFFTNAPDAIGSPVLVAAASSMKFPLDEMITAFEQKQPEFDVKISYASSGALFSQIKNGAPFDIFFSADQFYPRELEKLNLSSSGEVAEIYALGQIAMWVPSWTKKNPSKERFKILLANETRKVAIANPRHAPYGRAAIQAMQKAGVYKQVKGKLVFGENVSQAAQFASTGAAQAGLFAYSVALAPAMKKSGALWLIPSEYYDPIQHARLTLKNGNNIAGAKKFAEFISGPQGAMILKKYGFHSSGEKSP